MTTATLSVTTTLSPEQLAHYDEHGYVIVPSLLTPSELERIQAIRVRAEEEAIAHGGSFRRDGFFYELEKLASDETGETLALRKIQDPYNAEPDFKEITASPKILDIVTDLIGPEIYYHSSKLMFKPAFGGRRKPWHQDFAYWANMNTRQVTLWIAIDEATVQNGCIQVIPGSHKEGLIPHHSREDYMIDEDGVKGRNIVHAEMKPGDALFFNVLTLHASDPNHSPNPRLSAIIDFDSQPKPEGCRVGSTEPIRTAN